MSLLPVAVEEEGMLSVCGRREARCRPAPPEAVGRLLLADEAVGASLTAVDDEAVDDAQRSLTELDDVLLLA